MPPTLTISGWIMSKVRRRRRRATSRRVLADSPPAVGTGDLVVMSRLSSSAREDVGSSNHVTLASAIRRATVTAVPGS